MPTHIIQFQLSVDIAVVKDDTEYYAYCPAFKGLHVSGEDEKEAIKNAKDAVVANVISLMKHGEPIPCCKIIDEDMFPDSVDIHKIIHHENVPILAPVPA